MGMPYQEKKFNLPTLEGISKESVDAHLGLYSGYVKNFNAISGLLSEYAKESEKNAHALAELIRRRSFEFGGMRLSIPHPAQVSGRRRRWRDNRGCLFLHPRNATGLIALGRLIDVV